MAVELLLQALQVSNDLRREGGIYKHCCMVERLKTFQEALMASGTNYRRLTVNYIGDDVASFLDDVWGTGIGCCFPR